jgi:cytochrome oxidase Cu insertion factor (SCO1/SenC/PrrC family)
VNKRSTIKWIGAGVAVLVIAYVGYRAWWTPAIGGEPTKGESAPLFELEDQNGTQQSLAAYIANGPVIVAFYRGYW